MGVEKVTIGNARMLRRGATTGAALRTKLARAHSLIIRIEQEVEVLVEDLVAKQIWAKDEGLEKPARMGQVPFGRAYVRH